MRAFKRLLWLAFTSYSAAVVYHAALVAMPDWRFAVAVVPDWLGAADRAHRQRASPDRRECRVFLIGSSPVLYGLSASDMANVSGCAVVNASQMAYEEVTPYLKNFLDFIRPGDFVVLSDRQWTALPKPKSTCLDDGAVMCFARSLVWVPLLFGDIRWGVHAMAERSAVGDLMVYPDLQGPDGPAEAVSLGLIDRRIEIAVGQARLIRDKGATPLFAAVPILVKPSALQPLTENFAALGRRMDSALGAGVWIPPLLLDDPACFVPDAMHTSALGRAKWTPFVTSVLLAQMAVRGGS